MSKIGSFFLLALVLIYTGFSSPQKTLKGRVSDDEGKPLANVTVRVKDSTLSTRTGPDGFFILEIPDREELELIFSHPDYLNQTLRVPFEDMTERIIQVSLKVRNPILRTIKEEITVTAEADSIIDINLPSHRTILPSSVLTEMGSSNLAESVDKIPGVIAVGKGGYSMVPSIRGLAENRILMLVDGVPITSERRIGASASFINLGDIDRVEINRGPYSVFYGSGALGGIINIITKTPLPYSPWMGDFLLGYNTVRNEMAGNAMIRGSLGKWGVMASASGKKADDYEAPSGTVGWSRYKDYDLLFKMNRQDDRSEFFATFLHYRGTDIGKPSPTSDMKPRWYPEETNTLFTLGYNRRQIAFLDNLNFSVSLLDSTLETQADNLRGEDLTASKRNLARIAGTNLGFKIRSGKSLGDTHTFNFGIDFFGQVDVNDHNTEWRYDENGEVTLRTEETSLKDARRSGFGLYLDDKIKVSDFLSLNAGGRFDVVRTSNSDLEGRRHTRGDEFVSLYVGAILQVTSRFSLLANAGRAFRFPTMSELFYTGLTGRGTVFGNPDLNPETCLNLDVGFRYLHERFFVSFYGFRNSISNMIDKYGEFEDEEYYYRNLTRGRISGIEGEFYIDVMKNVELFLNFHHMVGREKDTDIALNYIPTTRLTFWGKYSPGNFWLEPRVAFSSAKKDPGPLEIAIDASVLFDMIIGLEILDNWALIIIAQNILDQTYRSSADEAGVDAPGRGIVFKVKISF